MDVEWDIITRGLRFTVLASQPIPVAEKAPEDPWLTALASWTEGLLDNWTVYTNKWPLGYQKLSHGGRLGRKSKTLIGLSIRKPRP